MKGFQLCIPYHYQVKKGRLSVTNKFVYYVDRHLFFFNFWSHFQLQKQIETALIDLGAALPEGTEETKREMLESTQSWLDNRKEIPRIVEGYANQVIQLIEQSMRIPRKKSVPTGYAFVYVLV